MRFLLGDYERRRRGCNGIADILTPRGLRFAAASDAMAGRLEQAHNAVARLRQRNSTLRVSNLKEVLGLTACENISQYEKDAAGWAA